MDPPHTAPPAMPLTKRGTRTTMGCSPQNIHLAHIFECSITYGLAHCQTQKFLRLPQRVLHWSCTQKQPFALQQCCRNRATRTNLSRLEPPILRTANPGTFQPYTPIKLTLEPCKLGNFSNVLPIQARAVQPTHRNSQPKEVSSEQDVPRIPVDPREPHLCPYFWETTGPLVSHIYLGLLATYICWFT